jgi:hypothetical protein
LELLAPVRGEGPRGALSSKSLVLEADAVGAVRRYRLRGGVRLTTAPPEPMELATESLDIVPAPTGAWDWAAPSAMVLAGRGEVAHAASGSGSFGSKAPPGANLRGPVRGTGEHGDFEGDAATLKGGAWSLRGSASLCRGGDTLRAERVTWRPDGSGFAEGRATGTRTPKDGGGPLTFAAHRADLSPGGYPIVLTGDARLETGTTVLEAPRAEILAADRALASGGVEATLREAGGAECRLRSERAGFEGNKSLAWAHGGVLAEGRNYTVEATRVEAHLDARNRAERLDARGEARFSGEEYDGEGDWLTYAPASETGEVRRDGRDALVIQKSPYRRLAAPVIRFGPSRVETLAAEGAGARRGRMEGAVPGPGRPAPAPGTKREKGS